MALMQAFSSYLSHSHLCALLLVALGTLALLLVSQDQSYRFSQTLDHYFPSSSDPIKPSSTSGSPQLHASDLVGITLVEGAVQKGAVCLDGSPPAYHLRRGSDSGKKNWLIHLEGGAWCSTSDSCARRALTRLGSSKEMASQIIFSGLLSSSPLINPDFYNWNHVKIRYCDGASFSGNLDLDMDQHIYYRGQKVWHVVIEDLLDKGMADAKKALLSGCSAGGLATFLHCDNFRKMLPKDAVVKCMSDAGYFLDVQDISGSYSFRSFFEKVIKLQNVQSNFAKSCDAHDDVTKCFFPEYLVKDIETPLFVLNPAYDVWQLQNIWVPDSVDASEAWSFCKHDPVHCSEAQIQIVQGYRRKLLESLEVVRQREKWGLFVNSCFVHCQSEADESWNGLSAPRIDNKTIADVIGEWFFERNIAKFVDCAYPCNPTCAQWKGWHH